MCTYDMVCIKHYPLTSGADESAVGERTPVKARMTEHIPPQWQICHVARQFKAAVAGPGVRETLEVKRVVERKDGSFDYGEWYATQLSLYPLKLTLYESVPMPSLRILVARYGIYATFSRDRGLNTCWAVHL